MKKRMHLVLLVCALFALPLNAESRDKSPSIRVSDEGGTEFSVGYSAILRATGADSSGTLLMRLTPVDALQFHLSVPSTSPFQFTVVSQYKRTITQSQNAGFHIGGGLGLGSLRVGVENGFALSVNGLAGIHFRLADAPKVQFHVDGGPVLSVIDGDANFTIGALSGLLGLSIIYTL